MCFNFWIIKYLLCFPNLSFNKIGKQKQKTLDFIIVLNNCCFIWNIQGQSEVTDNYVKILYMYIRFHDIEIVFQDKHDIKKSKVYVGFLYIGLGSRKGENKYVIFPIKLWHILIYNVNIYTKLIDRYISTIFIGYSHAVFIWLIMFIFFLHGSRLAPSKKNRNYVVCKLQRIQMVQSKIDNPETLATLGTHNKKIKHTEHNMWLGATICKQTQIT